MDSCKQHDIVEFAKEGFRKPTSSSDRVNHISDCINSKYGYYWNSLVFFNPRGWNLRFYLKSNTLIFFNLVKYRIHAYQITKP